MKNDLKSRAAFVTGGGRGMGRTIAAYLVNAGVKVSIGGRDAALLERSAAELGCSFVPVDVTDENALRAVIEQLGPLDILVNNAGAAVSLPFGKQRMADFNGMIALNLTSVFVGMQAVLPGMVTRGWGRIVNISSTAGLKGYGYSASYCAAKHGLIGLTRAAAVEYAKTGVTINAVCPGFTDTDMVANAVAIVTQRTGRTSEQALDAMTRNNPQGRLVTPDEVADAVLYLCGTGAAVMNGQSLVVAGGEIM